MVDHLEHRNELRQAMMGQRKKMSPLQVREYSASIMQKLKELEPVRKARVIMGFSSIKNEVNLFPFLEGEKELSRTILLPRVEKDGVIEAVEFQDGERTRPGSFGIREPQGEPYQVENIDVVLVPGLVFDYKGYRLGYGKGYYDRFLPRLRKGAFVCGVGYEFQVVKDVFPQENDIPVHWIITDKSELVIDWDYF